MDRPAAHPEASRQRCLRDAPLQIVPQQHPRLPSVHLPPAPSLLDSPTSWNAGQSPPTTKVCGFRLPRMGNLLLPPTRSAEETRGLAQSHRRAEGPLVNTFHLSAPGQPCESGMRENRTYRLSGGRRRALRWAPPPTRHRRSGGIEPTETPWREGGTGRWHRWRERRPTHRGWVPSPRHDNG